MIVSRWGFWNEDIKSASGDFITVGQYRLGEFRDLVHAEFIRAGSGYKMRPIWYTMSPHWRAIMRLAIQTRGIDAVRASMHETKRKHT